MGVKDLWSILEPVKKNKSLQDLTGQILAVDLSIWMCDTQQLQHVVQKPYLRIVNLMQLGVKPVFVVDGMPPELKWETIQKRLETRTSDTTRQRPNARFTHRGSANHTSHKMTRSRFKRLAQECCEMFDALGIPYIQSVGEAEAMCAMLNAEGLVNACITNDGDAFLYGARTVYRNFTLNNKDPHVEVYSMDDIERCLCLDRQHLVALALLLGCDYLPKGVPGVGKDIALKLLQELSMENILERFKSWSSTRLQHSDNAIKKPAHCGSCGHIGSKRNHDNHGCPCCKTSIHCDVDTMYRCTCSWHSLVSQTDAGSVEVMVYKKAIRVPDFPNQKVIEEFLNQKDVIPKHPLTWRRPKPFSFHKFAVDKMEWDGIYSMEKVIPLLTLYDLRSLQAGGDSSDVLQPHSIVKARIRQGVPCFEIQWYKLDHDDITEGAYYTTIEEQELVSACFPNLVTNFTENQVGKKNKSKGKKSVKAHGNIVNDTEVRPSVNFSSLQSTDISRSNRNPVEAKQQVFSPEEKIICYSLASESPKGKQTITRVEQPTCIDVDQDSNDPLPLSERLSILSKKSSLQLTQKQSKSHENQETVECSARCVPKEGRDHLTYNRIDSFQSERRPESSALLPNMSLKDDAKLCKCVNTIPTHCSGKNVKKHWKKGRKYKELHSVFDHCSILEQSTVENSVIEKGGEINPGRKIKSSGILNSFDHKLDQMASPHTGKVNSEIVTELQPALHYPEYSSTPASLDVGQRIPGHNVFSPIGMNLSASHTPQSKHNEESVNIPSLVVQKTSIQYMGSNQQSVCGTHLLVGNKTGEVGNFNLQSSVLSDWSVKELGSVLDDLGISMKECASDVQPMMEKCGVDSDIKLDPMFVTNRHRKTSSPACKIGMPELGDGLTTVSRKGKYECSIPDQHSDDGVNNEPALLIRSQNKKHSCESKENTCTSRTLLPINTQLGVISSQSCNRADDVPAASPVLLSLSERLKAKLIGSTGRRILSSLTNEDCVK